jgi:hypothetical protein
VITGTTLVNLSGNTGTTTHTTSINVAIQ